MTKGWGYVSVREPIKLGSKLRPSHREEDTTEEFIEKIRKEEFPDKPSRLQAYFIAPDADSAREWNRFLKRKHTYLVNYKGNAHRADGEVYTEVNFKTWDQDFVQAGKYARNYWEGIDISPLSEIVIEKDGEVVVIKEVDLNKDEKEQIGFVMEESKFRKFIRESFKENNKMNFKKFINEEVKTVNIDKDDIEKLVPGDKLVDKDNKPVKDTVAIGNGYAEKIGTNPNLIQYAITLKVLGKTTKVLLSKRDIDVINKM